MSRRTMDELRDTCDKACEILKKTHDGDLLDPQDLKLTELAVNGYLNAAGREIFEKLYQTVVVEGAYIKPWLHDIEHITRDHEGYIYYKGIRVEHYDSDYVYSEDAKNNLLELKRRCEFLEGKGLEVSSGSAIWGWDTYADEYGTRRLTELDALLGGFGLRYSRVGIYNSGREYTYFACGQPGLEEIKDHPVTQSMIGRYFDNEYEVKVESFFYRQNGNAAAIDDAERRVEIESFLPSCHGSILRNPHDVFPVMQYKTDFAENYENTKALDALLGSPGRSFQYTLVEVCATDYTSEKFFVYGKPSLAEIERHEVTQRIRECCGGELRNIYGATYLYGDGERLRSDELPPLRETEGILTKTHDYMEEHGLIREIRWEDYAESVGVNRIKSPGELEYEEDIGLEP